jgi:hypothetical protein
MMLTDVNAADHHDQILPESQINRLHEPNAECEFSVHQDGPDGPIVKGNRALKHLCFFDTVDKVSKIDGICSIIKYNNLGTTLHQQLYYKISCKREPNYCLVVRNCTVSSPTSEPYPIIDDYGCTLEPKLFEHVQYEDDFTAGIYNPLPIRFRGTSSTVQFFCVTSLMPTLNGDKCVRKLCTWNEYTDKFD